MGRVDGDIGTGCGVGVEVMMHTLNYIPLLNHDISIKMNRKNSVLTNKHFAEKGQQREILLLPFQKWLWAWEMTHRALHGKENSGTQLWRLQLAHDFHGGLLHRIHWPTLGFT